jgi:hypothetical protein
LQTGTKISGAAHIVLVGVAVFGGAFKSEPLPVKVREVSVISAEQFAAMSAQRVPLDVAAEPMSLTRPDPDTDTPDITAQTDTTPEQATPDPVAPPEADVQPEQLPDQPPPEADATDTAPVLEPPEPEVVALPPDPSPQPKTRPVDRVAPVPVAPPPPDATPDEVVTPQVNPDQGAENPQEPAKATAPEAANDRIVTEADETATLAPTRSLRPPARPKRRPATPAQKPVAAKPDTPKPSSTRNAVNDALAEALGESGAKATPAPVGPPLTGGEKDALRVAVSSCWNVGSLSSAALQTTVVVGVSMTPEGKPVTSSIRMLTSSGGPDAAAKQAYEAARRAIIRCGSKGYDLPPEKYGQWQEIEMTFNPERMRIK